MSRTISRETGALFKRLLGRNHIKSLELSEDGLIVFTDEEERISLDFKDIRAVRTGFYLDESIPYCSITVLMNDRKEYGTDVFEREETESILKHYATYQLGGFIPEKVDETSVVLQYGLSGYSIRLERGKLIETRGNCEEAHPLNEIEDYEIDKRSDVIDIRFKETLITLSALRATNVWIVLWMLERADAKFKRFELL